MRPAGPRVVVPNTTKRDAMIAAGAGVLVLSLLTFAILSLSKPPERGNILVGEVVAKQFTPQKEQQINFSGRRLTSVKQIDGEYLLRVRVEKEGRIYDVPVSKPVYESKEEGSRLEFVRPVSEQK